MRVFCILLMGFMQGCSGGSGSSTPMGVKYTSESRNRPKFAIVSNNAEEFWTIAEKGAEKAAADFNCEVIFRKPTSAKDQIDILNALSKQGLGGMAVSVNNATEQADDLKRWGQKMPIIAMDNDAEGSDRICYVGTDNVAAGKSAGRLVTRALPQGGTVAVFVGMMSAPNAQQRFAGLKAALDEYAAANKVQYTIFKNEPITDNANREQAQINAKTALEQIGNQPNVCFVGLWAYNAPMILEAAKSKGLAKKIKIVAFDEMNETLLGIAAGEIEGTIVQDPFNFAYQSIEILAAEAKGDQSKRAKSTVPHRVITVDGKVPTGETAVGLTAEAFQKDLDVKMGRK